MSRSLILGIETSCDETSASVVAEGRNVLSNVVASQLVHADYGGVVPELASREHLRNIVPVVREAMRSAGVADYRDLSAVAVTEGPGLAGALLVGISFAKALAFGAGLPLIAVNHLEGHIQAVLMESEQSFAHASPLLATVISGGHSHFYLAERDPQGLWTYRNVGRTLDDAAGEAFDKVAKLLGLPYPGGPWIDALAPFGNPQAVPFRFAVIKEKRHRPNRAGFNASASASEPRFDLSFSGIKTAVRRFVELNHMQPGITVREHTLRTGGFTGSKPSDPLALQATLDNLDGPTRDLIASFQNSVVHYLSRSIFAAQTHFGARAIAVSGGVSANSALRHALQQRAASLDVPIAFPSLQLSTDNAAMIAAAAWPKYLRNRFADTTLEAAPNLRLG